VRYETSRPGGGKVQRPGPDAPGGPRVEAACEVCRKPFWPRVVDVQNGKGKHCSTNCSSKALRKPAARCSCGKPLFRGTGGYVPERCGACAKVKRASDAAKHTVELERDARSSRWQLIQNGEIRLVTLGEFRRISGRSDGSLRPVNAARRLGAAWDGSRVDLDHENARNFVATQKREHNPATSVECSCGCGRTAKLHKHRREQSRSGQYFASRACRGRFQSTKVEIGGEPIAVSELADVSGVPRKRIYERISRGEDPLTAASRPVARSRK
jgi:hypothetical protein